MIILRLSSPRKDKKADPVHVLPIQAWYTRSQNFSSDPHYTYAPENRTALGFCKPDTSLFRLPGDA